MRARGSEENIMWIVRTQTYDRPVREQEFSDFYAAQRIYTVLVMGAAHSTTVELIER
jgi:hypothetical protein